MNPAVSASGYLQTKNKLNLRGMSLLYKAQFV